MNIKQNETKTCSTKKTYCIIKSFKYLTVFFLIVALAACKKRIDELPEKNEKTVATNNVTNNFFVEDRKSPDEPTGSTNGNGSITGKDGGNTTTEFDDETPTLLGPQLANPYTLQNMANAYNILYGTNFTTVPVTDLYVRFAPQNEAQFALLEDSLDLTLYDHPLDYEVIKDGDYYVDPTKSIEDLPFLYTVVEPDFNFPSGIPYVILSQIHIPLDQHLMIEDFAESMAAGAVYTRVRRGDSAIITRTDVPEQPTMGFRLAPCDDYAFRTYTDFVTNPCTGTGIGPGGGGGVGNPPPPPPPGTPNCGLPALTCNSYTRPKGRIRVWDTQLNGGSCVPLVNVKVTAKRWFKGISRNNHMYMNNFGEFMSNKNFKRKVSVRVFFRNANVSIRPMRTNIGIRLSLFTVKSKIGIFESCNMNTIDHIYYRPPSRTSKGFMYWLAAHGINARKYQWDQALADQVKPFTGHRLCIYLVKEGKTFGYRPDADVVLQNYIYQTNGIGEWAFDVLKLAYYTVSTFKVGAPQYLPQAIAQLLKMVLGSQQPDILYSYNTPMENLSSNEVNQQFYASFAKCAILKATKEGGMGNRWKYYFKAKSKIVDVGMGAMGLTYAYLFNELKNPTTYAISTGPTWAMQVQSALTAIFYELSQPEKEFYNQAEGFGEYYGHYLADRRYNTSADAVKNQILEELPSNGTSSSHKRFLELWNPTEGRDPDFIFKTGLFNDLEDDTDSEYFIWNNTYDFTKSIKAKDYEKAYIGSSPASFTAPEKWSEVRENLKLRVSAQSTAIQNLFNAYNVF